MSNKKKFYITTPIYYPNAPPHIGSAYTTVIADIIARFKKSQGYEVFYLTGTDEHGMKIERAARKANLSPKEFIDRIVEKFKEAWAVLDIEYDRFIRTTDPDHEETVKTMVQRMYERGDIYKGTYRGPYCVDCERYYTEKELLDGNKCPIHKRPVEILEIESYFFRLSKYEKKILELFKDPDYCPKYRDEMINKIKTGLRDISISRPIEEVSWGIPLPFDKKHVLYVWVDALFNYVSGVGYVKQPENFEKFWPADVHLIGKDIVWFHSVIWPALLMSAGLELPKKIFAHGFLTVNKQKISKSLGNVIDPVYLAKTYGSDAIRYYLVRGIPFGDDGDFSEKELKARINSDLADNLGNLVQRVIILILKYTGGIIPSPHSYEKVDEDLKRMAEDTVKSVEEYVDNLKLNRAVETIWALIAATNKYINDTKPWEVAKDPSKKTRLETILYVLAESLRIITALIAPIIPRTAVEITKRLGLEKVPTIVEARTWGLTKPGTHVKKGPILFKKFQ